jgi:endogenous inhibitor of DNA gyrase (YacG/DUF329 family)
MRCPICKISIDPSSTNRFRPFCSERCRVTDLGSWAGESYRIPERNPEDREEPEPGDTKSSEGGTASGAKRTLH